MLAKQTQSKALHWLGRQLFNSNKPETFLDPLVEQINPMWVQEYTPARVEQIIQETSDTKTLVLKPAGRWPGFEAGQHVNICIEIDGVRRQRTFSLSSSPILWQETGRISLTIKRLPGGLVTNWLHDHLETGAVIGLGDAFGEFRIPEPVQPVLFIAGGSGQGHGHSHGDSAFLETIDVIDDLAAGEQINSNVPHPTNPTLRAEHFALFALVDHDAVTHTAVASGDWSDAAIWEGGQVPGSGANVLIAEDVEVTVDTHIAETLRTVAVDGTLRFAPDVDTSLRVDTMIVGVGGTFEMGTEAAPIAADVNARLIIADTGDIDRAWDPLGFSRGLIVHGTMSLYGAETTSHLAVTSIEPTTVGGEPRTLLHLEAVPVNWRVGETLILAGTNPDAAEEEQLEILDISGNQVTVGPLQFNHDTPGSQTPVHVGYAARNASIESENPAADRRGHFMAMHTREIDIYYGGFYHLGRTNKLIAVDDAVLNEHGHLVPGTGTNPRGRYALHFHRNGVEDDGNPSMVVGSAVVDSLGWGYVNHSSNVQLIDNFAFDVDGAAFVTEAGDEIGLMQGNLAIRGIGSGEGVASRVNLQDFGHQGDGFWFQGSGVRVVDNVASGQAGHGFIFFTTALVQDGLGTTVFPAENLPDPSIANGNPTVQVGVVPIAEFTGNVAYASQLGAATRFHQLASEHSTPSVIEDLTLWNNTDGLSLTYTNQTIVRNVTVIGDTDNPRNVGVLANHVTRNITYQGLHVEGYTIGVQLPRAGTNVVSGGYFNNVENLLVQTATAAGRSIVVTAGVTFGTLTPEALNGRQQTMVTMLANFDPLNSSISHVFATDTVVLDFGEFVAQQVYFLEQADDFVPFPATGPSIPSEYVGLTNAQLLAQFGIAVGGELAPAIATQVEGIIGLI